MGEQHSRKSLDKKRRAELTEAYERDYKSVRKRESKTVKSLLAVFRIFYYGLAIDSLIRTVTRTKQFFSTQAKFAKVSYSAVKQSIESAKDKSPENLDIDPASLKIVSKNGLLTFEHYYALAFIMFIAAIIFFVLGALSALFLFKILPTIICIVISTILSIGSYAFAKNGVFLETLYKTHWGDKND